MSDAPNTGIPYVPEGTIDPAAGLNLALVDLDTLVGCLQRGVIDVGVNDPPVTPADGDLYIVGVGTGAWAGEDGNLARYVAEGIFWRFYEAGTHVGLVRSQSDYLLYSWRGSEGWVVYPSS
jgi:hypothetical protein